jgi:hypothetical protein
MGKAVFQGSADCKPLNQSIPNFEQITAVLALCYKPIFVTLAINGLSAQYGEVAGFLFDSFFYFFFQFCHEPPPERAGRCRCLILQTTQFATRKCLLEVSSMKKSFQGIIFSPNFSKGILLANRKSRITSERREIDDKYQI